MAGARILMLAPAHFLKSIPLWLKALTLIAENIADIRGRIESAARRAGRSSGDIALMAVTKTQSASAIREAYAAGLRLFGENRVQEFAAKASALDDLAESKWHLIGHLQSNKAGKAAELFSAIDSVDSLRLAQRLNSSAQQLGKRLAVLIEINVGGEAAKSGLAADSPEVEELLAAAPQFANLQFRGLMTIPPFTENPQDARPYFQKLRDLHDSLRERKLPSVHMDVLSMGMSHDFEVAIEEGSTCVRVGTAIFGERSSAYTKA
jgi:pyridoxal phosphate enzyme (YggS family)